MDKENTPGPTTLELLEARGLVRKVVDLDKKTIAFFEAKKKKYHASSGKKLMELILIGIATNKEAETIIKSILYPPK